MCQVKDSVLPDSQTTGSQLALGYLLSKVDYLSLVFLIDNSKVFPCYAKKSRKYCNNLGESSSGIFSLITTVAGSRNSSNFFAKPKPSHELNIANCNPLLIAVLNRILNFESLYIQ